MNVEAEERATLAARLGDDEVVEAVVVWDDEVLLDVHELVDADTLEVVEFLTQCIQTLV